MALLAAATAKAEADLSERTAQLQRARDKLSATQAELAALQSESLLAGPGPGWSSHLMHNTSSASLGAFSAAASVTSRHPPPPPPMQPQPPPPPPPPRQGGALSPIHPTH